jgi:hypothetical protein
MRTFKELNKKEKLFFALFVEPIALLTLRYYCFQCFLKGICPLHKKVD